MGTAANSANSANWLDDIHIIDTDAHITEPEDLWSSQAPPGWKDKLPHVEVIDGQKHWIVGKDVDLGLVHASGVVAKDGRKSRGLEFFGWSHDDVHVALSLIHI